MLNGAAGDDVRPVEDVPGGAPGGVDTEPQASAGAVVKFQMELAEIPSRFLARTTQ
jgi:hypothetical protein